MLTRDDLLFKIESVDGNSFDSLALEIFHYQYKNNEIYKQFVDLIGKDINAITSNIDFPFLPISFFKSHHVRTGEWTPELTFNSSGTTNRNRSAHHLRNHEFYLNNATSIFENRYGTLENYRILALLPSYFENQNSSLLYMINHFIDASNSEDSGFYHSDIPKLVKLLYENTTDRSTILFGVTHALLDLAENYQIDLSGCIIMETGGMKGRRKELVRDEVHHILRKSFNVSHIHSEYGMTELFSQAYSEKNGLFHMPSTLRILVRDITDPKSVSDTEGFGAINLIDLANVDTCSFIASDDLGKIYENETFEVLGRTDNSDMRGCNLMI